MLVNDSILLVFAVGVEEAPVSATLQLTSISTSNGRKYFIDLKRFDDQSELKIEKTTLKSRYFIAVVPPDDIRKEVTDIKQYVSEEYSSHHALKSPPHITLHMPFSWKDDKREKLDSRLEILASQSQEFSMDLHDFDCFRPRVIFINSLSNGKLEDLHEATRQKMKSLNILNSGYKDRSFHPHMTIAFRDLSKPTFEKAWAEFKGRQFRRSFEVKSICLLRHDGKIWQIEREFYF